LRGNHDKYFSGAQSISQIINSTCQEIYLSFRHSDVCVPFASMSVKESANCCMNSSTVNLWRNYYSLSQLDEFLFTPTHIFHRFSSPMERTQIAISSETIAALCKKVELANHTHHTTTCQDDSETTNGASRSNDPCQTNEQYHTENVLDTWQKTSNECAYRKRMNREKGEKMRFRI
jgi:hypothetical protein